MDRHHDRPNNMADPLMTIDEAKKMPLFCVKLIMVLERIATSLEKIVENDNERL